MEFSHSSTLRNARDNMILAAVIELDHLYRAWPVSGRFAKALSLFQDDDGPLELLNEIAYGAIGRGISHHDIESLRQDLEDNPIDLAELASVLVRPIGDCLKVFQRE